MKGRRSACSLPSFLLLAFVSLLGRAWDANSKYNRTFTEQSTAERAGNEAKKAKNEGPERRPRKRKGAEKDLLVFCPFRGKGKEPLVGQEEQAKVEKRALEWELRVKG